MFSIKKSGRRTSHGDRTQASPNLHFYSEAHILMLATESVIDH